MSAKNRAHHVVKRSPFEKISDPNRPIAAKSSRHLSSNLEALELGGGDLLRAEEVVGGNPAKGPPVDAIGSEAYGAVEHEAVGGFFNGPVGKGRAVEDVLGDVGVARDDHARLADAEGHEARGAAATGLSGELPVGEAGHEANAAEHREASGPWNYERITVIELLDDLWIKVAAPSRAAWEGPVEKGCGEPHEQQE